MSGIGFNELRAGRVRASAPWRELTPRSVMEPLDPIWTCPSPRTIDGATDTTGLWIVLIKVTSWALKGGSKDPKQKNSNDD